MRYLLHTLLCGMLAASSASADDTATPTPATEKVQVLRTRKLDPNKRPHTSQIQDWTGVPRLRLMTYTGDASFSPRFWYAVQDRTIPLTTRTWAGDVRGNRYLFSAQYTRAAGRSDISSWATEGHMTPWRLGPLRPGLGYRMTAAGDAQSIFSSGDMSIRTTSSHTNDVAIFDLGVGRYDRSYLRINGMYGSTQVSSGLNQLIGGVIEKSPFTVQASSRTEFTGLGFSGALRAYGFSVEGSATRYRPLRPRFRGPALPEQCVISTASISYISPLKVGIFARKSQISGLPLGSRTSLEFLNDGWTFGLTAQIP